MNIKQGDTVRITLENGFTCTGTVLSASNMAFSGQPDNWYIELNATSGCILGYTYWKQGPDGGTIELLNS